MKTRSGATPPFIAFLAFGLILSVFPYLAGIVHAGGLDATPMGDSEGSSRVDGPVRIVGIKFAQVDGRAQVIIGTTSPCKYKTMVLKQPDRLVIDIDNAVIGMARRDPVNVGDRLVRRIRMAQFSASVVRMVIDLSVSAACVIKAREEMEGGSNGLVVTFNREIQDISFQNTDGRSGIIITGTGDLVPRVMTLKSPDRIVIDIPEATLLREAFTIPVDHALVKQVRVSQNTKDVVRIVADTNGSPAFNVVKQEDKPGRIVIDFGYLVKGVDIATQGSGTRIAVKVTGNPARTIRYLDDLKMLVIDIEDSQLEMCETTRVVDDGVIDQVEVTQFQPGTVRVAIRLPYYLGHSEVDVGNPGEIVLDIVRSPLFKKVVVVDPGHGGSDPGAIGPSGLQEKFVTLDIALRLARLLELAGAKVLLTRTDDRFVSLPDRVKLANENNADLFVSVHVNSFTDLYPSGAETFYFDNVPDSRRLAALIQDALVRESEINNRKAKSRELYVLREARVPACLVEVAFISNFGEEMLLMSPGFRQKAAQGIYAGILSFSSEKTMPVAQANPVAQVNDVDLRGKGNIIE
ncbi:MAG: N-acetylmuramoyl-L-alanine amidase [Firmicutes bacterium]|nr:N-acetylmuramoyl-L-alanine amidase [Bacillota bacterium]